MIGVGVELPVNERFMLTGSVIYDKADASSDMTAQNNFGNPLPLTDVPEHQDRFAQPQGDLPVRQELVGHRRLRLPEVRLQRRPVQRLYQHDSVPGRDEQYVAELSQRLERLPDVQREHLLSARDDPVLTAPPTCGLTVRFYRSLPNAAGMRSASVPRGHRSTAVSLAIIWRCVSEFVPICGTTSWFTASASMPQRELRPS